MLFAHTLPYGRAPRSNSNSINNHQQPPFVPSELHGYLCRHAFRYAYSTATEVAKARAVTVTATSSQITPSDLNHQEHLDATHVAALLRVISFVRRSSHADQGGFGGDIELDVWLADVMTLHQWMLKLLQPYSPYTEVDRVLGELQNFQLTSFGDVQDGGQVCWGSWMWCPSCTCTRVPHSYTDHGCAGGHTAQGIAINIVTLSHWPRWHHE